MGDRGTAAVRSAEVAVTDGDGIQIGFLHEVGNPNIKGIEVLEACPRAGRASDLSVSGDTVSWAVGPLTDHSNVYRGTITPDFNNDASCLAADVAGSSYNDTDPIPQDGAFYYLVTGENTCGESDPGVGTGGIPRTFTSCP